MSSHWFEFLTDAEVADVASSVSRHVTEAGVDVPAVRDLLADWAVAALTKSHPDFEANRAACWRAIGAD